jgi:dihydroorotase
MLAFVTRRAAETCAVRVLPAAALTKGLAGREMAELGYLRDAGAVAFTDADRPVADPLVFRRCLQYAAALGAPVIHHAQDPALTAAGCVTEGPFASRLGLPAIPAAAEAIMLERDLALAALSGARYHADQVTTAAGIAALRRAKEAGLTATAGIAPTHFALNELDVDDYRTFFKLDPPLRAETDRAAVAQAVAEGLIDVVASGHRPQDEESKRLPFEAAATGAVGLETLLPVSLQLVHDGLMGLPALFARLSLAPARLLGHEGGRLAPGAPADLVLFDPGAPWRLDRFALRSKSKNSPFDRRRLQGRALKTWVGGQAVFDRAAEDAVSARAAGAES